MMFDKETSKPIMTTKRDAMNGQIDVVKAVTCICVLCSILSPCGYTPKGKTNAGEFHEEIVMRDYIGARHLGNSFATTCGFRLSLLRKIIIPVNTRRDTDSLFASPFLCVTKGFEALEDSLGTF